MGYVRLIRRIDMITRAFDRAPDDDRHADILYALWHKRMVLIKELKGYIKGNSTTYDEARFCRRRQVMYSNKSMC